MDTSASLESFCLLAKNARGRAAVQIIQEATAAPGLFAFGELLDMPNVQQVSALLPSQGFGFGCGASHWTAGLSLHGTCSTRDEKWSTVCPPVLAQPAVRCWGVSDRPKRWCRVGSCVTATQPLTCITDPAAFVTPRLMHEHTTD